MDWWPDGAHGAVSLTFDDGCRSHHQLVGPAMAAAGLRATFYPPLRSNLLDEPEAWRALAAAGHELGNHTIFHPCRIKPGNTWLAKEYDLAGYTARRWEDEVALANRVLRLFDGRDERSYGNTCHEIWAGPDEAKIDLRPLMPRHFLAARGQGTSRAVDPATAELHNLGTCSGGAQSAAAIIARIEEAVAAGGWSIWCFHDVDDKEGGYFLARREFDLLVAWLAAQRGRVWCAPLVDAARHLRDRRAAG